MRILIALANESNIRLILQELLVSRISLGSYDDGDKLTRIA